MNSSNHGLCVCMLVHCPAQDRIINFTFSLLWENKMWAVKEEKKKSITNYSEPVSTIQGP